MVTGSDLLVRVETKFRHIFFSRESLSSSCRKYLFASSANPLLLRQISFCTGKKKNRRLKIKFFKEDKYSPRSEINYGLVSYENFFVSLK